MNSRIFTASVVIVLVCLSSQSWAFLEGTPDTIARTLQDTIAAAGQAGTAAHSRLVDDLDQYRRLDLTNHTRAEIVDTLRTQARAGRFPAYVFERGNYNYQTGNNHLYLTGRNVSMYSLPIVQHTGITGRYNTSGTDYLVYLGEWRDRNGTTWVYAQDRNTGVRGWFEERNVVLVPNNTFRRFIADIQRGLQEYNLAAMRQGQKDSELINAGDSDSFVRATNKRIADNSRASQAGSFEARRTLERMLRDFQGVLSNSAMAKKTWEENDTYVQRLVRERKVSESLLGNGYKYDENGIIIYTPTSANIRQRPDPEAGVVAHTKAGNALRYLGERRGTDGAKWYLVQDSEGNTGWVSERMVKPVTVDNVRNFVRQIQNGLNGAGNVSSDEPAETTGQDKLMMNTAAGLSFLIALFALKKVFDFMREK